MVAWLSDGQCQEETKQGTKISLLGDNGAMRTTPTNAVEALICLPPLDLVVQSEARSAAYQLWILGCWSNLHPNRGQSSILMQLQQSDPIFNTGVDVMRPAYNFEPQYRVTMLTRIGLKQLVLLQQSKGSSGLQMSPRGRGLGLGLESMGNW